mmetsp:Transcript_16706/g.54604  ORF Transcript_16706/g.54604 Transcript_16706/m.54604 type:complete len:231 (-) Transcript_16706:1533-2225(-)
MSTRLCPQKRFSLLVEERRAPVLVLVLLAGSALRRTGDFAAVADSPGLALLRRILSSRALMTSRVSIVTVLVPEAGPPSSSSSSSLDWSTALRSTSREEEVLLWCDDTARRSSAVLTCKPMRPHACASSEASMLPVSLSTNPPVVTSWRRCVRCDLKKSYIFSLRSRDTAAGVWTRMLFAGTFSLTTLGMGRCDGIGEATGAPEKELAMRSRGGVMGSSTSCGSSSMSVP